MPFSLRCRALCIPSIHVLVVILFTAVSANRAQAQGAPDSVSVQGFLTDPGGIPVNATESITFKLYKNGTAVWTETQPSVEVTDGVFNVFLGSVTPLDTVAFNQPIELGVKVGADPEIDPRTSLVAAPFALGMRGMYAVSAEDGDLQGFNVIGGAPINSVGAGVVGATISGGGGLLFASPSPNTVTGNWGTVGGGRGNSVGGNFNTLGGGVNNTVAGTSSTVGGGSTNTASSGWATIGGGSGNTASGTSSTVPGGSSNRAAGGYSLAAGHQAKADHGGAFVWADSSANADFVSTGVDQFLIRAAGGVGIGTNSPEEQLHIIEEDGSTGIKLGGGGSPGPHGIVFDDNTADEGMQLLWRTSPNQLVLERSSGGTGTNGDDAFFYDRDAERFVFRGARSANATFSGHLVGFDNTASGSSDGLAIRLGEPDAGFGNNFISFFDGDGDTYGRIEGNGSDGVVYGTTGGDYAEYLPRLDPDEPMEQGDVVGIVGGKVTRASDRASRFMVITDRPAVIGRIPEEEDTDRFEQVAFIGQVPVRVVGVVKMHDYILPSGNNDGTGIAVSPSSLRPHHLDRIVGVAWESSDDPGLKKIIVEVGLDHSRATRAAFENEMSDLRSVVEQQQEELRELRALLVAP